MILFWLSACLYLSSCTTKAPKSNPEETTSIASSESCDTFLEKGGAEEEQTTIERKVISTAGTLVKYSYVGAAYTAELLWNVSAGIVGVTILCGPSLALGYVANSDSAVRPVCLGGLEGIPFSKDFGKNAKRQSENWDCPNIDSVSQRVRKISRCFAEKNQLPQAIAALEKLEQSSRFYRCLSIEEREEFVKQKNELKAAVTE